MFLSLNTNSFESVNPSLTLYYFLNSEDTSKQRCKIVLELIIFLSYLYYFTPDITYAYNPNDETGASLQCPYSESMYIRLPLV